MYEEVVPGGLTVVETLNPPHRLDLPTAVVDNAAICLLFDRLFFGGSMIFNVFFLSVDGVKTKHASPAMYSSVPAARG